MDEYGDDILIVGDLLDDVDAMVFSGDKLYNEKALERFKYYLNRWSREINNIENLLSQEFSGE